MSIALDPLIPPGSIQNAWDNHRFTVRLVNASNKRRFRVIVVGTGLAGASAAATLAELGYEVTVFTFHDSPRRAHSIAAQGGINAAKDYRNDGDSIFRLFYDTIKGGDFRSREANVYRLAQVSNEIIDQATAQGVPFAREYGGLLDNRSFGGAQVSRTFYARGQTGQQLLLGAYQAMMRQVAAGKIDLYTRTEMLDVVVDEGKTRGVVVRDLLTGEVRSHAAHAVVLATGGYSNAFFLSTNAKASNATAIWRAHKRGAAFANPCFTQIHPTCIPQSDDTQSKLTLMSESLRNDGRIWVPLEVGDDRNPGAIGEAERDYFLERRYPAFGNLVPRDVASRAAKAMIDEDRGVGPRRNGVYLDFADAISRLGMDVIRARYGNLFQMYERITGEDPYQVPMRIYPAPHYTMGGLWVDYDLMTTIPGCYAIGEANFSDHGANRLGASALMQGLADGYFILPVTIGDYLAPLLGVEPLDTKHDAFHRRRGERPRARRALPAQRRRALRRLVSPRARQGPLGRVRDGAQRVRPRARDGRDRAAARALQGRRTRARRRRVAQSVAGEGGPGGRFLRGRAADVPRRAASRGVLRRALPFRAPDPGRRGAARRRQLLLRGRLGVHRRRTGPAQRGADLPARPSDPAQLRMRLTLRIWRQAGPEAPGDFETYEVADVTHEMSFLELLDSLNEQLTGEGREPVAFDADCREGICGSCGLMIDGQAHGPQRGTATCQLHMRRFADGDIVTVEPFRSAGFPIVKDLVVDRSAFDRIIEAGGFITAPTGSAPDANLIAVPKESADRAMDAAACIGCGACVAACPNGAGQLFTAAKLAHLNLLPQGQPERKRRTVDMVTEMEHYFGSCTNHRECEAACPKEISIDFIAMLHRDYGKARLRP